MKKLFLTVFLVLVAFSITSAENLPFIEDYFYPGSIILCFTREAIGNRSGHLDVSYVDGVVQTNIDNFNDLAIEYSFVELEQLHPFVRNSEWNDNGRYIQNIYRVRLSETRSIADIENARTALEEESSVIWAEYETINRTRHIPNDPDYHLLWYIPKTRTNLAWDFVQGSDEIIIAITDTGTKWNHEDLADNIWINEAELPGVTIDWVNGLIIGGDGIDNDGNGRVDDVIGWDFFHNNNNPMQVFPGNQHGTHVAGCAGAVGDNEIGVVGPAMNTSLMICKGASDHHSSGGISQGYNQILYAADTGAHIINCSWGGPGSGAYPNQVVTYATDQGALVVAAAGNDDIEHGVGGYWDYPADAIDALCVAATDQNDVKTYFSDFGDPIDISAPGISIRSTWYDDSGQDSYSTTQGTSMASPIVAGIAALVKTLHPNMNPRDLRDRLMYTADFIDDLNPNHIGLLGTGRVNAFRATMYDKTPYVSLFNTQLTEVEGDGDGLPNPGETLSLVVSLENDYFFQTAIGVSATLSSDLPGVHIHNATVDFPNISGGAIVFNTNDPFIFSTDENLSEMNIPFTLTITSNEFDPDFPYFTNIDFTIKLTLQRLHWPMNLPGATTSSALIEDLNNDGINHIIFGDTQGNLHCLTGNKTQAPGFPVALGSNISSSVATGDVTGDGNKEIIANRQTGYIYAVSHEGNIIFEYNAGGQIRSNPVISGTVTDGDLKIIAVTFNNPRIIILNGDGSLHSEFPISSGTLSAAAVGDITGDGSKEVVFVGTDGYLNAISLVNGQQVGTFPVNLTATSWHGPIVGNFNMSAPNQLDIAVATVNGKLFIVDPTGTDLIERNIGNQIRTSIVAADITNNGHLELAFADMSGNVYLTDLAGNDRPGFPINVGSAVESTPVLADLTLDGKQEMIFGASNGYLYALKTDGTFAGNFPYFVGGSIIVSPVIGDVDIDDDVDILIANENSYHFIDYKRGAGSAEWVCFRGDSYRRGNVEARTLSSQDNIAPVLTTEVLGNYPNPFNPDTNIRFNLAEKTEVSINIYNIKGQLIKNLKSESLPSGEHTVTWSGIDNNRKPVSSGVYFYILRTEDFTETRKMLLLK